MCWSPFSFVLAYFLSLVTLASTGILSGSVVRSTLEVDTYSTDYLLWPPTLPQSQSVPSVISCTTLASHTTTITKRTVCDKLYHSYTLAVVYCGSHLISCVFAQGILRFCCLCDRCLVAIDACSSQPVSVYHGCIRPGASDALSW
jgi:hypothetical protein